MPARMKLDLAAGSPAPADAGRLARAAEAFGFDALWLAETEHEPFVTSTVALAATARIEVGTGVAVAFARSPTVIAQASFDLAAMSDARFLLGLGTQVRAHVERRFGMPWSAPAPRLGEWIDAIRAAWATWQDGVPFRVRSEHFDLSLMTPAFSPPPLEVRGPTDRPMIPISVAGVGPGLARLAGRVADGFQVHPLNTARYLAEVLEPALSLGESERDGDRAERIVPVFLAPTDEPAVVDAVRARIAFYASTPSYRGVLALHGRERIGEQLGRLAATGRWAEMPDLVDEEFLGVAAVVGPSDALPDALAERVAGHADRVLPLIPFEPRDDGEPPNLGLWERLRSTIRSA